MVENRGPGGGFLILTPGGRAWNFTIFRVVLVGAWGYVFPLKNRRHGATGLLQQANCGGKWLKTVSLVGGFPILTPGGRLEFDDFLCDTS
jgi:hypothetical protein